MPTVFTRSRSRFRPRRRLFIPSRAVLALGPGFGFDFKDSAGVVHSCFVPETTTLGDLIVRGASRNGRLAIGTTGQVLTVSAGTAAWTTLGTMAAQNANAVAITGGTIIATSGNFTAGYVLTGTLGVNISLSLRDTGADHWLTLSVGENLAADRTLSVLVNNANRTLTIAGNATISQDYSSAGSPTFAALTLTAATAYAVLCGGTTTANPLQPIASVGTAGQVLTSAGASALPAFANALGIPSTTTVLGSNPGLGTSYGNVGLSVSLPAAGTWEVTVEGGVSMSLTCPTPVTDFAYIQGKLRDTTNSADVTGDRMILLFAISNIMQISFSITGRITLAGAATVNLQMRYQTSGSVTVNSALCLTDSNIFYRKVSP